MAHLKKRKTGLLGIIFLVVLAAACFLYYRNRPLPQIPVCQAQMDQAKRDIAEGDRTENPLFTYVHGYYCALALSGRADSRIWKTVRTPDGVLFVHKDFVATELNRAKKAHIPMDAKQLEQYLKDNLAVMEMSRKRSRDIASVAASLDPAIKPAIDRHAPADDRILIALPSYLDDPSLWAVVKPMGDIAMLAPSWLSMHESGIILSSNRKISDSESHDYITQAMQQSKSIHIAVGDAIGNSARHEGSHGAIDTAIISLLKLRTDNPLYEGIASALASDSAVKIATPITTIELLNNPYPQSSDQHGMVAYYAGGKLWTALYRLSRGDRPEPTAWAAVLGRAVSVASDMASDPQTFLLDDNRRISRYMSLLLPQLHIAPDDFARSYTELNK